MIKGWLYIKKYLNTIIIHSNINYLSVEYLLFPGIFKKIYISLYIIYYFIIYYLIFMSFFMFKYLFLANY